MTERRWRILTALLAVAAALVLTHQVERHRAIRSPSGWNATEAVGQPPWPPRIGNSRWILSEGSQWRHEKPVGHWFLRAQVQPDATLTVQHGSGGPGVKVVPGQPTVLLGAHSHVCDGELPPAGSGVFGLIFERTQDGYTFRSGEARIACSAPGLTDAIPILDVSGGQVELISIGTQEWPAGVPVSGLGWMGGIALVGFFWMLLLEWERARRVSWPVVILTGLPCLPAALALWMAPNSAIAGVSVSLALVVLTLLLKGFSIAVGGKAPQVHEE